ncbi:hypothetical protein [Agrococcus sp. Marseille-Q4369]|uniref:hypothetical protein n=1 Tax=Agrococcus sp. Marseille-Q4369 TaxID=2810513 RepID=UPI001B8AFA4F|nr:hypothetical protein [Agrococcus sp. Marseille-Q4369]QUW18889.1 hypothetical protein JSQ78_00445 [Agrococcus sp. Marseille-Q4369]
MAREALASVTELAEFLGETIADGTAEHKRAGWCLRVASGLVRDETGRTWLGDDGKLEQNLPESVVNVTIYCASRVYDNREARTSGGIDDLTEGFKVQEAGAYLTASERRQLAAIRDAGRSGLGTVSTVREPAAAPAAGTVPTETPGVEFPWY